MYHGKMGFTHADLYSMPTYLRNYYYRKLVEVRKKENEDYEKEVKKAKKGR